MMDALAAAMGKTLNARTGPKPARLGVHAASGNERLA